MAVDLETAIQKFFDFSARLQRMPDLTIEKVLDTVVEFYRDVRIDGAELDADGDMLLLQWGGMRPMLIVQPTDLRQSSDEVAFDTADYNCIDVTRQVMAVSDSADFDDAAVQMSISLYFEKSDGDVKSSSQWIVTPDDLDKGLAKFRAVPLVSQRLGTTPARMTVSVGHCG